MYKFKNHPVLFFEKINNEKNTAIYLSTKLL